MKLAADGLPVINAGFIGVPAAAPARTPENFKCLQGPCRNYWYLETMSHAGNPEETWKALGREPPRQKHHTCRVDNMDLTDDNVYKCSIWDPMTVNEVAERDHRRTQYEQQQQRTEGKTDAE